MAPKKATTLAKGANKAGTTMKKANAAAQVDVATTGAPKPNSASTGVKMKVTAAKLMSAPSTRSSGPVVPEKNLPNDSKIQTRSSNANQHPGNIHNALTRKRRSKIEMDEFRQQQAKEKERKILEKQAKIMWRFGDPLISWSPYRSRLEEPFALMQMRL